MKSINKIVMKRKKCSQADNMCDIINICRYCAARDCNLKIEAGRLVDMGFVRCIIRSLKMQLCLSGCTLINWLSIFCMAHIVYRRGVVPWNQHCISSRILGTRSEIFCIMRKGEKQIQILDGY
jgi:hypothetical protein